MFRKVLIANRGEIAVRIIRALREMGIISVAVYSEADRDSLHTMLADEAICIGPAPAMKSYLDMERILSAAITTGAEAIHPGFGFLSENEKFARLCTEVRIKFIGPKSETIAKLGDKAVARATMQKAHIPVIPGTDGSVKDVNEALKLAKKVGFPVMIKAALGGGGKGMRISRSEDDFAENFMTAKAEALKGFSDDSMYIEKYIERPRHIEFQILADSYGNVIHLGERDCSIQRRHQKVLEEAPSVFLDSKLREKMGKAAVSAAKAAGYENAGTIEFLVDKNKNFYFMEMNTRIQVEHPVTEMITGIDLIKEQIRVAAGEKLSITQKDVKIEGHSIECRINAENPDKNFAPSPGRIESMHLPGGNGVRIDTHIYEDYTVSPFYDSMLLKLIVHGKTRQEAIAKMRSALGEIVIEGVDTNIDFNYEIINNPYFIDADIDTSFIEKQFKM